MNEKARSGSKAVIRVAAALNIATAVVHTSTGDSSSSTIAREVPLIPHRPYQPALRRCHQQCLVSPSFSNQSVRLLFKPKLLCGELLILSSAVRQLTAIARAAVRTEHPHGCNMEAQCIVKALCIHTIDFFVSFLCFFVCFFSLHGSPFFILAYF
jgi:hypothetical protein